MAGTETGWVLAGRHRSLRKAEAFPVWRRYVKVTVPTLSPAPLFPSCFSSLPSLPPAFPPALLQVSLSVVVVGGLATEDVEKAFWNRDKCWRVCGCWWSSGCVRVRQIRRPSGVC